ncbi:methionyl-tRNA formyltransferase [Candidatus Saccharibacteria bacterium]|nr:methionyl-tRNA formyltransferase [Candidatus Saccharibacteria bacterium]
MNRIIFFGNGPLAEAALRVLEQHFEVVFHAHTKEDLMQACEIKRKTPEAHGVLASFGVLIKADVLELFEPEGILNIHPSLLPKYRGPSPIESAILDGNNDFSVSVMKLAKAMDAGPVFYQTTLTSLPLEKTVIYKELAEAGARWICENIDDLPTPMPQDEAKATFCRKLDKSMGILHPEKEVAEEVYRKIVAFQGFPKAKYVFYGKNCAILAAHILQPDETAILPLTCANGQILSIDKLQPDGKKPMDAKSFINGYARR